MAQAGQPAQPVGGPRQHGNLQGGCVVQGEKRAGGVGDEQVGNVSGTGSTGGLPGRGLQAEGGVDFRVCGNTKV